MDLEKARSAMARWRILKVLDVARPVRLAEDLIRKALGDAELNLTAHEVRRELDYLEHRNLVEVTKKPTVWAAELTRYGIDLVEGTVPCEPGIARPEPL